jgi:hypothetical protein
MRTSKALARLAATSAVAWTAAILVAPTALASYYQRYVREAVFSPGSSSSSAWNRLTFNAASWRSAFGGVPAMGTSYTRTDGTSYTVLCSNTGSIYDSRTIAYGSAWCVAAVSNQAAAYVFFCDTGNG